ncbi:Hsp70 family protein [Acrocarpospora catenulata]|uniref:Hsp70 family protein n=1 Tax=Acrocarpospora catenulata TaxID=2836182 RepID=UPI001BD95267|nr:hypothetical protein [Acrocarpospora catenulata]
MSANDHKVVAVIDFGTHGTGFAWTTISPLNDDIATRDVYYFTNYSNARVDYPKNLTAILLRDDGSTVAWGHRARKMWAEACDSGTTAGLGYAYAFKMALQSTGTNMDMPSSGGFVDVGDRDRVYRLIVAYLSEVRSAAIAEITQAGYLEKDIRWCLTVPAIWDEEDKHLMRRAAVAAGLPDGDDRLLLSIEPEAAALYCYLRMAELADGSGHTERLGLNVDGARFMVIDCGGGTVDITAYETSAFGSEQISLREIGVATGGRLGSEYINHAFRTKVLADRLGPAVLERLSADYAEELLALDAEWEQRKVTAETEERNGVAHIVDSVGIRLSTTVWEMLDQPVKERLTRESGGKPGRITISAAEVEALFDHVVDGIVQKIREQLTEIGRLGNGQLPETLVLVGGFARAGWLRARLHREFSDRHRILVPQNPALAILEGAVHYAYRPEVLLSRRSRYTYGFALAMPWEEGIDPPERKLVSSEGEELCRGRFEIAVRRGQSVAVDEPFSFGLVPTKTAQEVIRVRLMRTRKTYPRYVDEEGCEQIGELTVDIRDSVGSPISKRNLLLLLYFGRTAIQAEALNPVTNQKSEATAEFEHMR